MAAYAAPHVLADKRDEKEKVEKEKASHLHNDRLFDPEALERGAKALRDINKSPYAKQVWCDLFSGGQQGRRRLPIAYVALESNAISLNTPKYV